MIQQIETTRENCWHEIGVTGDRSCPKLKSVIHCHNCPIYADAGRGLLEQEAPIDYLKDWTEAIAKKQPESTITQENRVIFRSEESLSLMIFRLGEEWLALPVRVLQEVTQPCILHTLPHRSNKLFLGLVNIRGEILLCVDIANLLEIENTEKAAINYPEMNNSRQIFDRTSAKRMLVTGNGEDRWVFIADEVCGVDRFPMTELQDPPVVTTKTTQTYTKGVFTWQDRQVNYLDIDLLFYSLNRRIL